MLSLATSCLLAAVRRIQGGGVIVNGHTLSRAQVGEHCVALARWFDFVRLEDLAARLVSRGRRPFCLLTFDDGKRNQFTEIAPELERRGVPAVFYVTTEPVSTGACFWFDRRNELIKALGHCPAGLELQTLKTLPFDQLVERLDRACARHGWTPTDLPEELRPMSWEQARSLARRGFTIGAHGQTHAILTRETPARACAEIEGSLARVGSELGVACRTFAFPNGNYTSALAQQVVSCGATTVMTTEPMWADPRSPLWRLPRVQLFGGFNRARIEFKLALAAVRGVLPNPDGTGRIYRRADRVHCDSKPPLDRVLKMERGWVEDQPQRGG